MLGPFKIICHVVKHPPRQLVCTVSKGPPGGPFKKKISEACFFQNYMSRGKAPPAAVGLYTLQKKDAYTLSKGAPGGPFKKRYQKLVSFKITCHEVKHPPRQRVFALSKAPPGRHFKNKTSTFMYCFLS